MPKKVNSGIIKIVTFELGLSQIEFLGKARIELMEKHSQKHWAGKEHGLFEELQVEKGSRMRVDGQKLRSNNEGPTC